MISKSAEYALRAVVYLAINPAAHSSANFLAEKTKIPRRYLNRVLLDLTEADLVRSRPGPGGGYELVPETDQLSILDVINAVSPIERIRECPLGLPSHKRLCPLHAELDRTFEEAEKSFCSTTIQDLVDTASPSIPLCDVGSPDLTQLQ